MGRFRVLAALLAAACASSDLPPTEPRVAYVGAMVWDGEAFRACDLVVQGGRIVSAPARTAAQRVELNGGFVVPPFCEAHNHNLGVPGEPGENEAAIARYLREGIFYVGVLSNLPTLTDRVRSTYNTPTSVDVVFANGPLTATGGYPIRLREFLLDQGAYPGFTRETLPGQGYFVIDDEAELEQQWPAIARLRPDFIKIMLAFSEDFARRRDDAAFFGLKGLNPALVPRIVERAHAQGLRVFAHVETGHDFHVAVAAGVDVIAHLPGYAQPTRIEPADARLAAQRGVRVMTTTDLIEQPRRRANAERYAALRQAQIENLRTLREAGVVLAAGSDEYQQTSSWEVAHLRDVGLFSNAEVLRMWSTDCARTLFPERRLGRLAPGHEASFLVLEGDPLADFAATRQIRLRVKEGVELHIAGAPPP